MNTDTIRKYTYEITQKFLIARTICLFSKENISFKEKALAFSKMDSYSRKEVLKSIAETNPDMLEEARRAEACRLGVFRLEFLSNLEAGTEKKFLNGYRAEILILLESELSKDYSTTDEHTDNFYKMRDKMRDAIIYAYRRKNPIPGESQLLKRLSKPSITYEDAAYLIEIYLEEHAYIINATNGIKTFGRFSGLETARDILARSSKKSDIELSEKLGKALEKVKF